MLGIVFDNMVYVQVYLYIPALIIKVNMNDCVGNVQIATETLDTTFLQPSRNCWPMMIIHLIGTLFIVIHLRLPEIQSNCVKTTDSINYLSTYDCSFYVIYTINNTIVQQEQLRGYRATKYYEYASHSKLVSINISRFHIT